MRNHLLNTSQFADSREAFEALVRRRQEELLSAMEEVTRQRPPEFPLVLEIGAGHGHFLASYAASHPTHWCIGIDQMSDRVRRADKKRERASLENLHFLRGEAREFLNCLQPGPLFQRVFILFPDPWPKKRHHKNRLLSSSFITELATRCAPGADLFFRTDHLPYFEEVQKTIATHPHWSLVPSAAWLFEQATVFQERAESFSSLIAACRPGAEEGKG